MFIKTVYEISTGNIVESNKIRIELVKSMQNSEDLLFYLNEIREILIKNDLYGFKQICQYKLFFENAHIENSFKKLSVKLNKDINKIDYIIKLLEISYNENAHDGFLMSWAEKINEI